MRTRVYVDGFNLYYGAVKRTRFKWLDPVRLTALLLPRECLIDRLRYFTARISGKLDPQAPRRQQIYLKALSTLPEVDIHFGRFLAKTAWRPLVNLPVAGRQINTPSPVTLPRGNFQVLGERPQTLPVGTYPDRRGGREAMRGAARTPVPDAVIAEFHTMEEKGSDVNLAAYLLNDAWEDSFEAAVVISNDTDFWCRSAWSPRNETAGLCRLSRPVVDRPAIAPGSKPCSSYPACNAGEGAASGHVAGHDDHEATGLVTGGAPIPLLSCREDTRYRVARG